MVDRDRAALDAGLLVTRRRLERLHQDRRKLDDAVEEVRTAQRRLDAADVLLAREGEDVRRLEGPSLSAALATLLGRRADRLAHEREELAVVVLVRAAAEQRLQLAREERDRLRRKVRDNAVVEDEWQRLLQTKERLVREDGSPEGATLEGLAEQEAILLARLDECQEAADAAAVADRALSRLEARLVSASSWGLLDVAGGGLVVSAVKLGRIADAQTEAVRAREALARYQRELRDLATLEAKDVEVRFGMVLSVADLVLDGLVLDLVAHSRIRASRANVAKARAGFEKSRQALEDLRRQLEGAVADLGAERERLLVT